MPDREIKAHFIDPMPLLRGKKLAQGGLPAIVHALGAMPATNRKRGKTICYT
jgi:hypothetical protein